MHPGFGVNKQIQTITHEGNKLKIVNTGGKKERTNEITVNGQEQEQEDARGKVNKASNWWRFMNNPRNESLTQHCVDSIAVCSCIATLPRGAFPSRHAQPPPQLPVNSAGVGGGWTEGAHAMFSAGNSPVCMSYTLQFTPNWGADGAIEVASAMNGTAIKATRRVVNATTMTITIQCGDVTAVKTFTKQEIDLGF